jgi:DNA-binding GntR family transcriptional regulator
VSQSREHAIITAALRLPPTRCSTRGIAEELGLSQSTVSRFWRSHLCASPACDDLESLAVTDRLVLAGLLVTEDGTTMLFRRLPPGGTPRFGMASQGFLGRWRAVLAADFARPEPSSHESAEQADIRKDRFRAASESLGPAAVLVTNAVTDVVTADEPAGPARAGRVIRAGEGGGWSGLIAALSRLPEDLGNDGMADVVARLQHWYRNPDGIFVWVSPVEALPDEEPEDGPSSRGDGGRRPAPTLEDEILRGIQTGLSHGEFAVGDEISEQALARYLGMGRARLRRGVDALQEQGLVGVLRGSGVSIQLPTRDEVAELYAARNALGTLAVRAAARRRDLDPRALTDVLERIRSAVRQGDSPQVQKMDALFQTVLAHASGLARIPPMLESFHQQMMLYISAFGVEYDYPMQEVLEGDRLIATAVGSGDQAAAVAAWHRKMQDGVEYMLELIREPDFGITR